MNAIDKQALREAAGKVNSGDWSYEEFNRLDLPGGSFVKIDGRDAVYCLNKPVGGIKQSRAVIAFIATFNPNVALALLDAEPVAWTDAEELRDLRTVGFCEMFTVEPVSKDADMYRVIPLYTAQPVQETGVYKDMLNIVNLLENNEWAEHCTSTVLGSLLESEITRLVGKEQPAPVVPEEVMPGGLVYSTALPEFESKDSDKVVGYYCFISGKTQVVESQEQAYADAKSVINACRAAMLQGGFSDGGYRTKTGGK